MMTNTLNAEVSAAIGFPVRESTVERLAGSRRIQTSVTGRLTAAHASAFAGSLTPADAEHLRASEAVGMADLPDVHRAALVRALDTDGPAFVLSSLDTFVATGAGSLAQAERARKAEASRQAAEIVAEARQAIADAERVEAERTEARGPQLRMTIDGFRAARRITEAQHESVCETLRASGVTAAETALAEALDGKP